MNGLVKKISFLFPLGNMVELVQLQFFSLVGILNFSSLSLPCQRPASFAIIIIIFFSFLMFFHFDFRSLTKNLKADAYFCISMELNRFVRLKILGRGRIFLSMNPDPRKGPPLINISLEYIQRPLEYIDFFKFSIYISYLRFVSSY